MNTEERTDLIADIIEFLLRDNLEDLQRGCEELDEGCIIESSGTDVLVPTLTTQSEKADSVGGENTYATLTSHVCDHVQGCADYIPVSTESKPHA